ncbi:hypothetical protein BCR33DRAFT_719099, partial [Rhizoclosmatium globosum]
MSSRTQPALSASTAPTSNAQSSTTSKARVVTSGRAKEATLKTAPKPKTTASKPSSAKQPAKPADNSLESILKSVEDYSQCTDVLADLVQQRLAPLLSLSAQAVPAEKVVKSRIPSKLKQPKANPVDTLAEAVNEMSIENVEPSRVSAVLPLELRALKSFALKLLATVSKTVQSVPTLKSDTSVELKSTAFAPVLESNALLKKPDSKRPSSASAPKSKSSTVRATGTTTAPTIIPNYFEIITKMCLNCATGLSNLESYEASLDSDYSKPINGRMGGRSYWNFEVEKALSNVITRLIESGQTTHAVMLLKNLHPRLSAPVEDLLPKVSLETSTAQPPPKKKVTTTIKPRTISTSSAAAKKSVVAEKPKEEAQFDIALLLVTTVENSTPSWVKSDSVIPCPPPSLVAATLFNALRCIVLPTYNKNHKTFESILLGEYGLYFWCNKLKAVDSGLAAKMFDAVFRSLHKAAAGYTDPVAVFSCKFLVLRFFIHSTSFSQDSFADMGLRSVLALEKSSMNIESLSSVISGYFDWVLDSIEAMKLPPTKINVKHVVLIDYCAQMSKKISAVKLQTRVAVLSRQIHKAVKEIDSPLSCLTGALITSIEVESFLSTASTLGSDLISEFELVNSSLKSFRNLLQSLTTPTLDMFTEITRVFNRILDAFKKATGADNVPALETKEILVNTLQCFDWWFQLGTVDPFSPLTRKLLPSIVTLHLAVFKMREKLLGSVGDVESAPELSDVIKVCLEFDYVDGLSWTSTTFYNVGSSWFRNGDFQVALVWLRTATDLLAKCWELSLEAKKSEYSPMLVKRHEAVAMCYHALHDAKNCESSYVKMLEHLIQSNYTSLSLDSSTRKSLEKMYKMVYFTGSIIRSPSLLVSGSTTTTKLVLLDFEVTFLMELAVETMSQELLSKLESLILASLALTEVELHPIRRAKFLIHKANLLRMKGKLSPDAIQLSHEAIDVFKNADNVWGDDIDLESKSKDLLAFAYMTHGICLSENGEYQAKPFRLSIELWKSALDGVPMFPTKFHDEDNFANRFASKEQTYHALATLAEFFGVLNQPLNQINSYRLMLRMLQLFEPKGGKLQETIRILSGVGRCYLSLGYTGKAGLALVQAQGLIEAEMNKPLHNLSVGSMWSLVYAHYLCNIGNSEKGLNIYENTMIRLDSKSETGMLHAFSKFVYSNLMYFKGNLAAAINEGSKSVRRLQRFFNVESNKSTLSTRLDISQMFFECCSWLGSLLVIRGSVPEAEYFFKQGLLIAESVKSFAFRNHFAEKLAELKYRRGYLEDSRKELSLSVSSRLQYESDSSSLEIVTSLMRQGDLQLKAEELDDAMELYTEANNILEKAMSSSAIASVEDLPPLSQVCETPREKNFAAASPKKSMKDVIDFKSSDASSKCYGLAYLRTEVTSKMGHVLDLHGKLEEAEKRVLLVQDSPQRGVEKAEYLHALSSIQYKKLLQSLTGNPLLEMFADSAFSVPWCVPPKTTNAKARKTLAALDRSVSQLEELLQQAFNCARSYAATHILYSVCHQLALLNVIRAYLTGGVSESTSKEIALACAFYLDQSKGVTGKREQLGVFCEKSLTTSDQSQVNSLEWTVAEFSDQIIDRIPSDWVVVSLSADPTMDDLYITRMTRKSVPVTFRLPMKRQAIREGEDDGFGLEILLAEIADIIATNNNTAKVAAEIVAQKRDQTREEKLEWWTKRRELDERLKDMMCHLEKYWIGGFKGLLIHDNFKESIYDIPFSEFKSSVEGLIVKAVAGKAKVKPLPLDPELCCMILKLGTEPDPLDVEDVLYYLMDAYQYAGCSIGYDEINIDSMESVLTEAISRFHRARLAIDEGRERQCLDVLPKHTVLVLDKKLQTIPWESLPCIRGTSVHRRRLVAAISKQDAFFVLNPGKDLVNTEKEFKGFVKSNSTWEGIIGRAPTELEFEEQLSSKSLFCKYFGHGAQRIRKLDKCAVTFLMGCSSGNSQHSANLTPALVSNLWDVTDGDIDRFSKTMFCHLGLANESVFPSNEKRNRKILSRHISQPRQCYNLTEAVAMSREGCELEYLIGAAPVVYGVP